VPPVPDPGDENIDLAVGVVPDFRAGSLFVDGGVGGILELLQQNVVLRIGGGDFFGLGDRAVHAFGAFGQHQRGAECNQQFAPLDAHGFRHGQGKRDAARGGDKGQRNAGVSAGRFDELLARAEQAALLGIRDHRRADAAFDGVGGLRPSILARMVAGAPSVMRLRRTSGVWPMDRELSANQFAMSVSC